jgi:hypothetical protein
MNQRSKDIITPLLTDIVIKAFLFYVAGVKGDNRELVASF